METCKITSNPVKLTPRQRRAIPLILAAKSIETGCRSAGIVRELSGAVRWVTPQKGIIPLNHEGKRALPPWRFMPPKDPFWGMRLMR